MKIKNEEDDLLLWSYLYDSVENNDIEGIKTFLLTYSKMRILEEKNKLSDKYTNEKIEQMIPKSLRESEHKSGKRSK